ncbi:hypothetical protein H2200_001456 [Cladophialophora chaetospira]|uniref:Uncharacterized protein n=1 Tax=Cladophialophora chaetospira TaxID=386627 RepID=A0AA38XKZ8_9EURO|nr:hypothetical protein H2200_001456 [Cladophialophora chaetospira]
MEWTEISEAFDNISPYDELEPGAKEGFEETRAAIDKIGIELKFPFNFQVQVFEGWPFAGTKALIPGPNSRYPLHFRSYTVPVVWQKVGMLIDYNSLVAAYSNEPWFDLWCGNGEEFFDLSEDLEWPFGSMTGLLEGELSCIWNGFKMSCVEDLKADGRMA